MKILIKLVVVALLANAIWRAGVAYASTYDVPLTADGITLRREEHRTVVLGRYSTPVAVLPGYEYQWPFDVNVDAYVIAPPTRPNDLIKP